MKIRGQTSSSTTFNDLDLDKRYSGHDSEQHSKGFSRRSDILRNINAGSTVIFKHYTQKVFNVWKALISAIKFWNKKLNVTLKKIDVTLI